MKHRSLLLALGTLALIACSGPRPAPGETPTSPDMASALTTRSSLQGESGKEHWRSSGPPKRGGVLKKVGSADVPWTIHLQKRGGLLQSHWADVSHEEPVYRGGAVRTGPLPAAILDYAWPPEKAREKFQPDPDGAKKLLAQAGYGPGQLAFNFQIAPREVAEGEVIQKRLEAAGMNVRLDVVPTAASTTSAILLRGEYEIAWGAVSPAIFFPDRWLGSAVYTGGSYNVSRMSDPELDRLAVAQAPEMDKAKRKQIIDRMQDRLHEIMAYVPGLVRIYYRFYSESFIRPGPARGSTAGRHSRGKRWPGFRL